MNTSRIAIEQLEKKKANEGIVDITVCEEED